MTSPAPASQLCLVSDPSQTPPPPPRTPLHSPHQGESRTWCQHPAQLPLQGVGAWDTPLSTHQGRQQGTQCPPPWVSPLLSITA